MHALYKLFIRVEILLVVLLVLSHHFPSETSRETFVEVQDHTSSGPELPGTNLQKNHEHEHQHNNNATDYTDVIPV